MRLNGSSSLGLDELDGEVDVLVLGGGPAGCATGLALARRGLSTVVVERTLYEGQRIGETLPPGVQKLLVYLGVWDKFLAEGHSPSFGIQSAWGSAELRDNDFIFNPYGSGWHIDRTRFDAMLARAAGDAGATVFRGARPLRCEAHAAGGWIVDIDVNNERRRFRASLLVDATGRSSSIARKQSTRRLTYDSLVGVWCLFQPRWQAVRSNLTLVEAAEAGWWYSAVLPDSRLIAVFMTDADLYAKAARGSANYWLRQLQHAPHTQSRAAAHRLLCAPAVVAASSSRPEEVAGRNWLAVGDAAMAFDPLSSQGVYRAIQSAIRSMQAIEDYFSGNEFALQEYAAWVKATFESYLLARQQYYSQERRWPGSIFWQRRANRAHLHRQATEARRPRPSNRK